MHDTTDRRLEERIAALNSSFTIFRTAAERYPRELVRLKPTERAFSATEVVYHMLDVERLWQRRIHELLSGTSNTFQQMDPDKEAREGRYNAREYDPGITELKTARNQTQELVSGLKSDQLELTGIHSTYGPMNIYAIFAKMEEHDRTHAAQLERTLLQIQ